MFQKFTSAYIPRFSFILQLILSDVFGQKLTNLLSCQRVPFSVNETGFNSTDLKKKIK